MTAVWTVNQCTKWILDIPVVHSSFMVERTLLYGVDRAA